MSNETNSNKQDREIKNVGVLDLTGMKAEELANLAAIKNVGTILVPESLAGKLASMMTANIGLIVPIPDDGNVKPHVIVGAAQMSGEALANPPNEGKHVLVVMGPLIVTTPVSKVGYDQLIVVGPLVAPRGSETALIASLTKLQGQMIFYTPGAEVKVHDGQVKLSGKSMANANGNPEDILLVEGQVFVMSPVQKVGYKQIVIDGQLFAPRESRDELEPHLLISGQVAWYSGVPRLFTGSDERFAAVFFEFLKEPITLIINGIATIEADVTAELLRNKVTEIILNGMLEGPKHLIPILQALTVENNGMISTEDENEVDDE